MLTRWSCWGCTAIAATATVVGTVVDGVVAKLVLLVLLLLALVEVRSMMLPMFALRRFAANPVLPPRPHHGAPVIGILGGERVRFLTWCRRIREM